MVKMQKNNRIVQTASLSTLLLSAITTTCFSPCFASNQIVTHIDPISYDVIHQTNEHDDKTLPSKTLETSKAIVTELRDLYKEHVLPIEQKYNLHSFLLPKGGEIRDSEFVANPIVLLIGQYSTGKVNLTFGTYFFRICFYLTVMSIHMLSFICHSGHLFLHRNVCQTSFIRHLIGNRDFPGIHVGPEPTTDKFIALAYGSEQEGFEINSIENMFQNADQQEESPSQGPSKPIQDIQIGQRQIFRHKSNNSPYPGKIIKGNSLTVLPDLPFHSLSQFGSSFLTHFEGSILPAPLLQHLIIIDSPGILSGEKQRLARAYDFAQVSRWFADRADLILLLFDAHKLDISDELKEIMETVTPHNEDKIRCILNKADQVGREELVRVYGSLMWSMGKIFLTPENIRVYVGSFWEQPLKHTDFRHMFVEDERLLVDELMGLPMVAAERKVNEMVRRIRMVKVHVCLLSLVRRKLRGFGGRRKNRDAIISALKNIVRNAKIEFNLSDGDIPNLELFADKLMAHSDWSIFPCRVDRKVTSALDRVLAEYIPDMMERAGGVEIGALSMKTK